MGEWQPINTAPRDKPILVWGPRSRGSALGMSIIAVWGKASHVPLYGFVSYHGDPEDTDLIPATHWMPLPNPPASP